MDFELEYRIGNRKVSKREWERHMFHEAPRQVLEDQLKQKLRSLRCLTHGQTPKLGQRHKTRDGWQFDIEGCCDDVIARAQQVLAS